MLIGYEVQTCIRQGCGITFAVPKEWDRLRRNDHTTFYCPNGHGQHYSGESSEEKLRRERDRLAQRVAEWQDEAASQSRMRVHAEKSAQTYKGHLTRTKRRIKHGVCPCCRRSFVELARHMASKHPAYTDEKESA